MITIGDLLWPDPRLRRFGSKPEMDPLTEDDALQEAQLLDVRFDALRSTVGLLFELRLALQLREGNTGVLVAQGVRELSWTASPRSTARTAWTVGGSTPRNEDRLFGLELGMWPAPGARLKLVAESAAFLTGNVPGLDQIPDYIEDDEATIRAGLAGWHSEFVPVHAVFLDPAPAA
ncbi:hypothetical protein [Amycolatopsis sp. GM8]|uniref:hypothetical protein n=1 Tax=Amycolatopsis sp. GM8 TaxID=2896530 RepID=UPI001F335563|nr:hypothetical protein [Amycolatopsis sp. GM8]